MLTDNIKYIPIECQDCLGRASENGRGYCNKFHISESDLNGNNETIEDVVNGICLDKARITYKEVSKLLEPIGKSFIIKEE